LINRIYVTMKTAALVTVLKIVKNFFLCNHKNIDKQKGDLLQKPIVYCFELRESGERPLQKTAAVTLPLFS
jgi:hypothetical protein